MEYARCWVKLKLVKEWNREETKPGEPDDEDDIMYGMKVDPSNRADDATPNDESANAPDTKSMRSDSITPLLACESCRGTMVSCEMFEEP